MNHPQWEAWCFPLLRELKEARDWKWLSMWCRTHRYGGDGFRNCLAWLEEKALAKSYYDRAEKILWVRTAYGTQYLLTKDKTGGDSLRESGLGVPASDLGLDGFVEPMADELGVGEDEATRNLHDDLAFLRRDGVIGEEPLLIDGGLEEGLDEFPVEPLDLGVGEEKLSETRLTVTVEETERRLDDPSEVEQVEHQVSVNSTLSAEVAS
jgi:hypothetical protein